MTNPTPNQAVNLFVTHMDTDGPLLRIWAQINKDDVVSIETLMHRLIPQFDKGIGCPVPQSRGIWPGAICCALFEQGYYRAQILDLHHTGAYKIQFIDYGNIEIVQLRDIRLLDGFPEAEELRRVPPLVMSFIVADILPRNRSWDEQVLDGIRKDIRYSDCPGRIVQRVGAFRFIRMLYGERDFARILVEGNLAVNASVEEIMRAHSSWTQPDHRETQIQVPRSPRQISSSSQQTRGSPTKKYSAEPVVPLRIPKTLHYQDTWRIQTQPNVQPVQVKSQPQNEEAAVFRSRILEIGSRHEVKVSYVEDGPLMFSVQVNGTLEELNNLMYRINQTHSPQPLVEPPVIGSVCLGRYTNDKSLLRAVVMQVREHDCKLHYVDFGHGEILPYTDIFQLPREYINPRVLSIRFTMSEVNELRVTDEMKEYFKKYVTGKTLLLHVRPSEGSPLIQYGDLYDAGRNVKDILRAIFGEAPATWPPPLKLQRGTREIVRVSSMDLPIIFVQIDDDLSSLESFVRRINDCASSASPLKTDQISKGLGCLARSSRDSKWYRAEVLDVSADSVKVFYVDYGGDETIPFASLRSIRDNVITKTRAQAIRCILNDYDKEIALKEMQKTLEAQIMGKTVAMIVTQVTQAGPCVDLYDSSAELLINIMQKLKRTSALNGNVDSRTENYNEKIIYSPHSNANRSDDQINKWNPRAEVARNSESNNSMERGRPNNWKNEENEPRRYDNRYQNRDKEWSPRFDRSNDSNANIPRGGRESRGNRGNGRYVRGERNGSVEKTWNERDSDASSRSSGRSERRGRGNGGRGRRDGGRTTPRDNNGFENDRGGFKNTRSNGLSERIRDNRRDFDEKNENKQSDIWTKKTTPKAETIGIPMPNITVGAVKNCELVFINDPGDFHVQLSPDYYELEPVMESIASTYENGGRTIERSSMKEGMDCVALYSEDSRWYRAKVQSVDGNGATVRFVDYGNVETVDFAKIKELQPECAKLSAQAIACKLLAAAKTSWDINDIDKFSKLTTDKCLEAEFVANDNNVFEILLREVIDGKACENYINEAFSDGADLVQAKNNAHFKGRQRQGRNQSAATADYAGIDEKWFVEEIAPGTKENVIITWFTNPDTFYCQTLKRKNEFISMMNEIQQVYRNRQPINEPLQVGAAVMAIFSDDGALYRAEVLELNKARGNIVRYIDFGNTAMVEQRDTYRVEKRFMKIPKQAVNCSLKNIVPANGTNWSKSNKQEIEKCFDGENFNATFHETKDGKYIISLQNGDIDVAGLLVEKSLASFAVSAQADVPKNVVDAPEKMQIEEPPRFDISLLAGQILRVKVSNVESATKFYIQLPSASASEKVIDAFMTQNNPEVMPRLSCREVCIGAGCLVNTDDGWRRAVVVNCSRTTGFDVRLIDTGANEEIPLDCMLALPGPLSVMQNQAVECCLKNATSNLLLDENLRDRIENLNVIIVVEEVDNNRLIVKLYDTNGEKIKLQPSEEEESICPVCPMPILYSTQRVTVSHVEHSSSVWLKKIQDVDIDGSLLTELFEHYGVPKDDQTAEVPPLIPDTLCAAKSSDENWYRGKILRTTETGALVQYIDYGNSENISLENLRKLDARFNVQSQTAIEVALIVTLRGRMEQQQEILKSHILDEEFTATMFNVHKKWVAELTNAEGKISEKLSKLEEVDTSMNRRVETTIPEMVVGGRYKVTCHHADSPASFWLQRNDELPAIEELQEKLQIAATSCPTLEGIPEEGTLCLAMYSVDDLWYRAEVIIADPEITSIRFVDFGNTDIVYTNQGKSKKITDSLKSIKRYAIKCRLDVIPCGSEDWTTLANEWFEGTVVSTENLEALVIADSSPRRVELFVDDKSLVDELVERNFATRINTEEDLFEEIFEREVDPRAAYVSHAVSPSEFWIQQEKYVNDLEILADRFIVADMFPKPKEITEGLLCVAKFPEDESWYRARVISHADTGTEVIYIDYGNSAISTEIREIPEDVAAQPAFSKKCCLAMPEGIEQWSEEACVEFVQMAADGATIFQLDVLEEREDVSVVRLTQDGKDIVDTLGELCTTRIPIIEERLPPLGEENSPNVVVSHANSPSDFSIQAESAIKELELMVDHLTAAESFLTLDKIEEGTICAAKFPEDEQWYRAKILSHGDAGTEVLYIDYGNSAITTELRVLPEDIVQIPALSTCCSLLMPDYIEAWSKEACEKFIELVNEGATMFQYEVLENKEQTIVRLSIGGNDIVETLASLCPKKRVEDSENAEVSLENERKDTEEETKSNETSGVEIVTVTDTSSLSACSKSEVSIENSTLQMDKLVNEEEIIQATVTTSGDDVASEKIEPEVAEVKEVREEVSKIEEKVEEVLQIEEKVEEVSKIEEKVEEVSNIEEMVEKVPKDDTIVQDNLKAVLVDDEKPKIPEVETIPETHAPELSEENKVVKSMERRCSIPEDKILPGCINKGEDSIVPEVEEEPVKEVSEEASAETKVEDHSSLIIAEESSISNEKTLESSLEKCPRTSKTPHSEKLVAGVVTLQEKIDDLESDEILKVVIDENIPK